MLIGWDFVNSSLRMSVAPFKPRNRQRRCESILAPTFSDAAGAMGCYVIRLALLEGFTASAWKSVSSTGFHK